MPKKDNDASGDNEANRNRQFKVKLGRTVKVNDKLKILAGDATVSYAVLRSIKDEHGDALLDEQEVAG